MADIASLSFWEFVEERLNICTRRRRGIVPLTDDKILVNVFFANLIPGLDADTVRMHQLLFTRPTVVPRNDSFLFFIYKRFYNFLSSRRLVIAKIRSGYSFAHAKYDVWSKENFRSQMFFSISRVFFWFLALRAPMQGHWWVSLREKRLCL